MKLVIMGPPGSGKGVQSDLIVKEFGLKHISSGDLFRNEIKSGSEIGLRLKEIYDKGLLGDPNLVFEMVKKELPSDNYLLDGFPRNVSQAKMLEGVSTVDKVLFLDITDDIVINRISSRRKCSKCGHMFGLNEMPEVEDKCNACGGDLIQRDDDREEVVKNRMKVYRSETEPLLDYYSEKLIRVDGAKPVAEVFGEIKKGLE